MSGLRKRTGNPHVRVPRPTVRDTTISYRALGVLAWVLDRPDGWDIRAEQMSHDGARTGARHLREGRDAIRTALRELAEAGYYRLERRRMRNGQMEMGTAVSDEPVESWAEQWRVFAGKPVPVVEQPDGSFLVRYPDGTLLPDDWPPPDVQSDDVPAGQTGDGFSGPGTGAGKPAPGFPAPGFPATGNPAPLGRGSVKAVGKEDPPSPRPRGAAPAAPDNPDPAPCEHGRASCRACGTTPRQLAAAEARARREADAAARRAAAWCSTCFGPNDRYALDPATAERTDQPCPHCHPDGPRLPVRPRTTQRLVAPTPARPAPITDRGLPGRQRRAQGDVGASRGAA